MALDLAKKCSRTIVECFFLHPKPSAFGLYVAFNTQAAVAVQAGNHLLTYMFIACR